jgi:uncharacterized membrane protein YeiH
MYYAAAQGCIFAKENQMDNCGLLILAVIFGGSIAGIFITKTPGFGRYTTSALILTLVLFGALFGLIERGLEWQPVQNLLFAVAGYAGGFIATKSDPEKT